MSAVFLPAGAFHRRSMRILEVTWHHTPQQPLSIKYRSNSLMTLLPVVRYKIVARFTTRKGALLVEHFEPNINSSFIKLANKKVLIQLRAIIQFVHL